MTSSIPRLAAAAAACVALGLGLTGCSFSYRFGTAPTLAGDEAARQISTELAAQYGRPPEKVTCPDLPGEVGAKITCQLTDSGNTYDVAVTTTSVVDERIKFDIKVAATPVGAPPPTAPAAPRAAAPASAAAPPSAVRPAATEVWSSDKSSPMARADAGELPGRIIAKEITEEWRERNGRTPYPPTCPDLPAVVGTTVTCQLVDRGRSYDIGVATTSVRGILLRYTISSPAR